MPSFASEPITDHPTPNSMWAVKEEKKKPDTMLVYVQGSKACSQQMFPDIPARRFVSAVA